MSSADVHVWASSSLVVKSSGSGKLNLMPGPTAAACAAAIGPGEGGADGGCGGGCGSDCVFGVLRGSFGGVGVG